MGAIEIILGFLACKSLRSMTVFTLMFSYSNQVVLAQAPVNDVVSWPPGLLLLATIMYAAIATAPDRLWEVEPAIGFFLANGLPKLSFPGMKRVNWVASACHFLPGIRSASGVSNFWIRTNDISKEALAEALKKVLKIMHCVYYVEPRPFNAALWRITPAGLVVPARSQSEAVDTASTTSPDAKLEEGPQPPTSRDFLLFAAVDYHAFREWHVNVNCKGKRVFSTDGMPPSSVIDVESPEEAIPVVVAQMVRRPNSQSPLRAMAHNEGLDENGPYSISVENIPPTLAACSIDFHSYAPEHAKVSATLQELADAYYRVVQYIKGRAPSPPSPNITGSSPYNRMAQIDVGQSLWIAILSGAVFDEGRLTIQNLPGRRGVRDAHPDYAYLERLGAVLEMVEHHLKSPRAKFSDIVYSNGIARRSAYPFLLAGLFAQAIACYFLTVGTSAGIWTSVALANSLFVGRLTDLHSVFWGKTTSTDEPGMKMQIPGSTQTVAVATFDRTAPRQGGFRSGLLLNLIGLIAAILGAIFQETTRTALGFGPFAFTPAWVAYTSITLCLGMSALIAITVLLQQSKEKTWSDDSEIPTRWMIYTTLIPSCVVSGLAVYFLNARLMHLWPILDGINWLSGFPLGMIENGYLISVDHNTMHMVLLNRWIMGAVASSIGSVARR